MTAKTKKALDALDRLVTGLPCEYPSDPCVTAKNIERKCDVCDSRDKMRVALRNLRTELGIQ